MSRCKYTKQGANDYYDDHIDRYYEEKKEAWMTLIAKEAEEYYEACENADIEPEVAGFAELIDEEFEFPEEGDWLSSEYEGAIDSCADQAYEEERDRRMGL